MPKVSVIPWIIKKLKGAIGIVEDTDTATHAIASGKYVVWKGTLCKASSAIDVNDTLSTGSGGNLTVVDNGGLNDVQDNIPAVYDGLDSTSTTSALSAAKGKTLNEKSISNTISGGTLTDIQNSLITFCQAMALNDTKPITFTLTTASAPFQALTYYGTATKAGLSRFIFKMQTYSWNADEFIIGTVSDGTWGWNELALNSKFEYYGKTLYTAQDKFTSGTITVPDLSKYFAFELTFTDTLTIIAFKIVDGTILWGGMNIGAYASNGIQTYACRYAVSGNDLTINATNRGYTNGTDSNYSGLTAGLKRVVGLIPYPNTI